MSMVVFPFKDEDPEVVMANLGTAVRHPRVSRVMAVGAEENDLLAHLSERAGEFATPVEVILQERIGRLRPGKGDGMNTALRRFLLTREKRIHFYDADITNLDASWIDGAEEAADQGHPIVRHYFPRASTDAMVTWMITRPILALGHPATALWEIRQPLGGELLLTRPVVERLVEDDRVADRSDWGIDTVLTYATAATGLAVYEHYVAGGKQHALYGSLGDLRVMVHECFEAALTVASQPSPPPFEYRRDPPAPAPAAIGHRVAYDVEATLGLLTAPWSSAEKRAARLLPRPIAGPLLRNQTGRPTFAFLDADRWYDALVNLLDLYRPETGWRDLLFRLWVGRVLAYTTTVALSGHGRAMEVLEETVAGYAARGAVRPSRTTPPPSPPGPAPRSGGE